MDLTFTQSTLSDISYLRQTSPIIAQFLVSEVCRFITKRSQGNLDTLKISRELENEGVEISNRKIDIIIRSLKAILYKVLKQGSTSVESQSQVLGLLSAVLAERCSFKEKMINAIVTQVQAEFQALNEHQAQHSLKTFFEQIRLKQLVSFDCVLSHDFSASDSKNLKRTYATLIFKISEADGQLRTRTLEVNLDELKQFKEEIARIEETLS
jgi:hypothetical protein